RTRTSSVVGWLNVRQAFMSGVLLMGNSNRPKSPSCRTSGLPHDLHRASPHTRSAFEILQPCCVSVELTAFWMMFLEGYIGAPPTVTACSVIARVWVSRRPRRGRARQQLPA